jgi:hypothetical protein
MEYDNDDDHHHHVAIKELGHLLTRSGLTHPEVSSVGFLGSFCLLGNMINVLKGCRNGREVWKYGRNHSPLDVELSFSISID